MSAPNVSKFKEEHDFDKRKQEAQKMRDKYPDRIPVIVERAARSDVPEIDKKKYLVPKELTIGQFLHVIRKRIKLDASAGLYIHVKNTQPSSSLIISSVYEEHHDEDGFLYVTYSGDLMYGN